MKNFSLILLGILIFAILTFYSCAAHATALLVQTKDIWTYNNNTLQPYNALSQAGVTYNKITHNQLSATNLSPYDFIFLLGSADDTMNFDNFVDMNKIENYVQNGGLALIHYADWNGNMTDIAPGGVDINGITSNSGDIVSGYETDPLFDGVTSDDLDGWSATAHGYLINLPQNANTLIVGDGNNPIYARYQYGKGEVWVTTMTMEWGMADHDLLLNELRLANKYSPNSPVPEPTTVLLLGAGLISLIGYRKRTLKK